VHGASAPRLVASIGHPAENVMFDGKLFRGRTHELRLEGEGVSFERHGEMGLRLYEALYEEFGITLEAEDLKLDGVHQGVEQGTFGERLVENQDVEEGQGVHVGDLGEIVESEGAGLGIEGRRGNTPAVEFDDADLVEHRGRKIGPHAGLVLVAKRLGGGNIVLSLLAQVGGDILDSLGNLGAGQLKVGIGRGLRNLFLNGRVKLVQGTGGLGGLAQNVASSEAGEIIGGVVKAKLVCGAMGAEQLQLSVLDLGIHLHNGEAIIGILVRIHLKTDS